MMRPICKTCPTREWCFVYRTIFDIFAKRITHPELRARAYEFLNSPQCLAEREFSDLEPTLAIIRRFQTEGLPLLASE